MKRLNKHWPVGLGVTAVLSLGLLLAFYFYFSDKIDQYSLLSPLSTLLPALKEEKPPPKLQVLGWIPYWDQKRAFETVKRNPGSFDVISLFWYGLSPQGEIVTYKGVKQDREIIDFAKQENIKVLAILANLIEEEGDVWDHKRVELVIENSQKRKAHIEAIVAKVEEFGFDGVNIDYEALERSQRDNFSRFVQELSTSLHSKGKILGVAIHPKTSENNPKEDNGSHAQDWVAISRSADQMYFMTYGEHSLETDPGPVASITWVNDIISYAKKLKVPQEKIILGIGLYGLEWQREGNDFQPARSDTEELLYTDILKIASRSGSQIIWDRKSHASYIDYDFEGREHVVWFENRRSVSEKIKFAMRNKLGGIALWRLGGEDQELFEEIAK